MTTTTIRSSKKKGTGEKRSVRGCERKDGNRLSLGLVNIGNVESVLGWDVVVCTVRSAIVTSRCDLWGEIDKQ